MRTASWIALCSLALLLVAANAILYAHPPSTSPIMPDASPQLTESAILEDVGPEVRSSKRMIQSAARPLFMADRRPWQAPRPPLAKPASPPKLPNEPVADAPPAQPPDIRLLGVQATPDGVSALITSASEATPRWVSRGEEVGGWTISGIEKSGISVERGEHSEAISLYPYLQDHGDTQ